MRKQWAYEVAVSDGRGRLVYTGKYITYARAEARALTELADAPNGTANIYGRFDGSCVTIVNSYHTETRDFDLFEV